MISWGSKFNDLGNYSDKSVQKCSICTSDRINLYSAEQEYFLLYGLPLFKTKTIYYRICTTCDSRLKIKNSALELPSLKRELPSKYKLKYFWGWIILLPILLFVLYFFLVVIKK